MHAFAPVVFPAINQPPRLELYESRRNEQGETEEIEDGGDGPFTPRSISLTPLKTTPLAYPRRSGGSLHASAPIVFPGLIYRRCWSTTGQDGMDKEQIRIER